MLNTQLIQEHLEKLAYRTVEGSISKYGVVHCTGSAGKYRNVFGSLPEDYLNNLETCHRVRTMFDFADIQEFNLQYGMNNVGKGNAPLGNELIIRSKNND